MLHRERLLERRDRAIAFSVDLVRATASRVATTVLVEGAAPPPLPPAVVRGTAGVVRQLDLAV